MSNGGLRVAIVGGGIGGLSLANALVRHGVSVRVFEQAPALGEIGAGVLITPNSLRLFERMGLGEAIDGVGARVGEGSSYYRMDGTPVAPILTTDSSGWNGMYGVHRADLLAVLERSLPAGVVNTGHRCVHFEQDADSARLTFENGSTATADAVVAADGIHSVLQAHVVEPSHPTHSGSVAYRGLIPAERLPSWPTDISQLWMGDQRHFLVYPVRSGTLINYVGFVPSSQRVTESWSAVGDPAQLAAEFAGWAPPVRELLGEVESTFWWGLYDREPLSTWSSGRLTLMGDAAHPMLPHLGQGANQAVEDAVTLAALLADADPNGVSQALSTYEGIRHPRTSEVQRAARANGQRYDSHYADLRERDAEISGSVRFRSWLYDHDADQALTRV